MAQRTHVKASSVMIAYVNMVQVDFAVLALPQAALVVGRGVHCGDPAMLR